jgi:hypothetical protein
MLASNFTFWDALWTMIVFFAWIMFFTWVVMLLIDNFRRTDHGGGAKAGGALTYTIARPDVAGSYEGYNYGSSAAGPSTAEELSRLSDLRAQGAITDEEFADLKARAMAAS